jgi:hypothetical protein
MAAMRTRYASTPASDATAPETSLRNVWLKAASSSWVMSSWGKGTDTAKRKVSDSSAGVGDTVVGEVVGDTVVGEVVGDTVGETVGDTEVGEVVREGVGDIVVGEAVGDTVVGEVVGDTVGDTVLGETVGDTVLGEVVGVHVCEGACEGEALVWFSFSFRW